MTIALGGLLDETLGSENKKGHVYVHVTKETEKLKTCTQIYETCTWCSYLMIDVHGCYIILY